VERGKEWIKGHSEVNRGGEFDLLTSATMSCRRPINSGAWIATCSLLFLSQNIELMHNGCMHLQSN